MKCKHTCKLICSMLAMQTGLLVACGISSPAMDAESPATAPARHAPPAITRQPADVACSHYVALDGDDDNPGTLENPWATLQHAADMAQPGDTVCLREGVYHQYAELTRSGAPGQPITYAATPGETVWLDGHGAGWKYGFDLGDPGVSHIAIIGLNMRHWQDGTGDGGCIISWSDSDYVTIRDAELHHCGHGGISFYENSDYVTVENVAIHDNTLVGMDCGDGPCRHWVLRNVRAVDNGLGDGDTAADGIAIEDGDDILVEDCEASGNSGDGFDFKSSGTTLRRVIAAGNGRDNIKLWGERSSLTNGLSVDAGLVGLVLSGGGSYTVTHSLIASRRSYGYLVEFGADNDDATPVTLHNTIFYNDDPEMGGTIVAFSSGVQLQADHNLYYNPYREEDVICAYFLGSEDDACFTHAQINDTTWFARTGQGEHSLYGDPLFVDASDKDFRLSGGSPAVDAGSSAWSCPDDLGGHPRPAGSAPDLGPYEYQETMARAYVPLVMATSIYPKKPLAHGLVPACVAYEGLCCNSPVKLPGALRRGFWEGSPSGSLQYGLGEDDRHIASLDAAGVALAAIQGLHAEKQALETEVAALKDENGNLQEEVADLEARVAALERSQVPAAQSSAGLWLLAGLGVAGGVALRGRRRKELER